jgi:hypothetical protein
MSVPSGFPSLVGETVNVPTDHLGLDRGGPHERMEMILVNGCAAEVIVDVPHLFGGGVFPSVQAIRLLTRLTYQSYEPYALSVRERKSPQSILQSTSAT